MWCIINQVIVSKCLHTTKQPPLTRHERKIWKKAIKTNLIDRLLLINAIDGRARWG